MKRTPERAKRYVLCYYIPIAKLLLGIGQRELLFSTAYGCSGFGVCGWCVIFALQHRANLG
jgi:hypothetical protein